MKLSTPITSLALLSISQLVSGHLVIFEAMSPVDGSVKGAALGYIPETERAGGSQLDVAVFDKTNVHDQWNANRLDTGCGVTASSHAIWVQKHNMPLWLDIAKRKAAWTFLKNKTPAGGEVTMPDYVAYVAGKGEVHDALRGHKMNFGIPVVAPGGMLRVGFRQINEDGAGDQRGLLKCRIDSQGNARQFPVTLEVRNHASTQYPPCVGDAHGKSWHKNRDCYIELVLPKNLGCSGEYKYTKNGKAQVVKKVCMIRCENNAVNGPFGGCIPVREKDVPAPPVKPPVKPPVQPPVKPPVQPPVKPPVKPPVQPPVKPPVSPPEYATTVTETRQCTSTKGVPLKPNQTPGWVKEPYQQGGKTYHKKVIIKWKIIYVNAPPKAPTNPPTKPPTNPPTNPPTETKDPKTPDEKEPETPDEKEPETPDEKDPEEDPETPGKEDPETPGNPGGKGGEESPDDEGADGQLYYKRKYRYRRS
ncbi:hypothetical protein TWF506_003088 [Arthrobotrys conoides]|uniref:Uncharacterized protein n=1 Tax=Arthrobotrys conoides TaxID=74498 RepID=A0AAN8N3G2_9PEZI